MKKLIIMFINSPSAIFVQLSILILILSFSDRFGTSGTTGGQQMAVVDAFTIGDTRRRRIARLGGRINSHSFHLQGQLTSSSSSSPSYSDDFLLSFHNQAQDEKQATTNKLKPYNDLMSEEQADIEEWKDSFDRNGFADFTPPMTEGLNCLMVGDGVVSSKHRRGGKMTHRKSSSSSTDEPSEPPSPPPAKSTASSSFVDAASAKLPWEEERGADVTALEIIQINPDPDNDKNNNNASSDDEGNMMDVVFDTRPVVVVGSKNDDDDVDDDDEIFKSSKRLMVSDPDRPASVYDCIVDQGLMDSVLSLYRQNQQHSKEDSSSVQTEVDGVDYGGSSTTTTVTVSDGVVPPSSSSSETAVVEELMSEAATAIREHGIYVLVTSKENLPPKTQQLLDKVGKSVGLEWIFELDGISNDDRVVSVARRYCTGEMPKVGKLATNTRRSRYQVWN